MKNQPERVIIDIPLQEPTTSFLSPDDNIPVNQVVTYRDAMEHVLNEMLFPSIWKPLMVQDAMDIICTDSVLSDAMEHVVGYSLPKNVWGCRDGLSVDAMNVLVETISTSAFVNPSDERQLKNCSIRLERIDNQLSFLPKEEYCKILTNKNMHHTRSHCRPKPKPVRRHPRAAQVCDSYIESDLTSDDEPKNKKAKSVPVSDGPSLERMEAQNRRSETPKQRVLPSTSSSGKPSTSSSSDNLNTEPQS